MIASHPYIAILVIGLFAFSFGAVIGFRVAGLRGIIADADESDDTGEAGA